MTKFNTSKCDQTQIVTKLKNSNCDKTFLTSWQNLNYDKSQFIRTKTNLKGSFSKNILTTWQLMQCFLGSVLQFLRCFVADQCTKRHNENSQPGCLDVFDKNWHALSTNRQNPCLHQMAVTFEPLMITMTQFGRGGALKLWETLGWVMEWMNDFSRSAKNILVKFMKGGKACCTGCSHTPFPMQLHQVLDHYDIVIYKLHHIVRKRKKIK